MFSRKESLSGEKQNFTLFATLLKPWTLENTQQSTLESGSVTVDQSHINGIKDHIVGHILSLFSVFFFCLAFKGNECRISAF